MSSTSMRKASRTFAAAALLTVIALPACAQDPAPDPLASEEAKTLYALGLFMARNLAVLDLSAEELEVVQTAIQDAVLGNEPKVDLETYGPKIQAFAQGRAEAAAASEKQAAASMLEEMVAQPGAQRAESGLIYIPITAGTGASPTASDTVRVHYHGTLRDGTVFDSSVERGTPATFGLGQVIPCWTEGVQMLKEGGKAKLVCPPELAYGDRGAPPTIPPGAALTFEVELLEVVKSEAATTE